LSTPPEHCFPCTGCRCTSKFGRPQLNQWSACRAEGDSSGGDDGAGGDWNGGDWWGGGDGGDDDSGRHGDAAGSGPDGIGLWQVLCVASVLQAAMFLAGNEEQPAAGSHTAAFASIVRSPTVVCRLYGRRGSTASVACLA
jgi:hypothetical protein